MNDKTEINLSTGEVLTFPVVQLNNYEEIYEQLDAYSQEIVKAGSNISFIFKIRCSNLNYNKIDIQLKKIQLKKFIKSKIEKVYNIHNEYVKADVDINIIEGSVIFLFYIDLKFLRDIDMDKLKILTKTIIICAAIIIVPFTVDSITDNITIMKSQQIQNEYETEREKTRYDFLLTIFEKYHFSNKEILSAIRANDTGSLESSYSLITENPVKESIDSIIQEQQEMIEQEGSSQDDTDNLPEHNKDMENEHRGPSL